MAQNSLPSNWNQYFDPSAFTNPNGSGGSSNGFNLSNLNPSFSNPNPAFSTTSSLFGNDVASQIDPIGGLLGGLFGGGGSSFKPYIDANGNYVYADPRKHNPVPVTQVPGASLAPNKTYKDMANNISALTALFPQFASIISGQAIPQAQAALAGAQATAPGYEAIANQNELQQGKADAAALTQASAPGGLLDSALAAQKQIDPEYYATRALTAQKLAEQLGGIGPTVSKEIGQGLAQENAKSGTLNSPSQLNTVSNAIQYGKAGQDALTQAITSATSAMPALTSGMNAFQMTTGRSPTPNTTTGTSGLTNASALGSNLAGNLASAQQANNLNATNVQLNSKDWADYLGQVTSSIGNLTSSAGGIAGIACWIARRVYGESNPKWKQFRDYLFNEAPIYLKEYYLMNGESIAKKLTDSQCLIIKTLMDKLIGGQQYV